MSTLPITPSEHRQKALELMTTFRALAGEITGFAHAKKGRRAKIGTAASLPEDFLQLLAVACDANPAFAAKVGLTGAQIRDRLDFAREFGNVAKETHTVADGIADTVAEVLADLGQRGLNAYAIGKRLMTPDETESLLPHLEALQRALGRGRPAKRKKGDDPTVPVKKPTLL